MNIKELKSKWIWKRIDEFWNNSFQCVAWAKQAILDLYWEHISSFSWSAINWRATWSPFNEYWNRVYYTIWLVPSAWDVIFFNKTKTNKYGHVAIADEWCTMTQLMIIEQNAWNWKWDWLWANAITKRIKTYNNCLWWFTINLQKIMENKIQRLVDLWITTWKNPNSNVTRQEIFLMLWQLVSLIESKNWKIK